MATNPTGVTATDRKNRRDLYLIIGIFILVLVGSTALYKAAERGAINMPAVLGTSNNGVLVEPPLRIEALGLRHPDGSAFDFARDDGAWTLLVPVSGACEGDCAQNLYLTRQVRTALGRDAGEVERLAVALGEPDAAAAALIEREHPGVALLTAAPDMFAAALAGSGVTAPADRYYLVDPYGWVMMFYTPAHDGKALMADLKFLLKYAPDRQKD